MHDAFADCDVGDARCGSCAKLGRACEMAEPGASPFALTGNPAVVVHRIQPRGPAAIDALVGRPDDASVLRLLTPTSRR